MAEKTIFPREEKADVLFNKILNDPWACEKLQGTFCNSLFCNEDNNFPLSPAEFSQALFNAYHNRDLSAFLMAICQNTLFDLLRNSFLIPYRFNADGRTNPIIMTDESGNLLPGYKTTVREKDYQCTDHPRAARHCQAERDRGRSLFCCLGSYDQTGEKSSYGVHFLWAGFSGRGKHPL